MSPRSGLRDELRVLIALLIILVIDIDYRTAFLVSLLLGALFWNKFCVLVALRIILVIELNGRTAFLVRSLLQLL